MLSPRMGLILTVLLLAGPVRAQVREEFVLPAATDAAINAWLEPHLTAFDPTAAPRGALYLHLSGTADVPENSQLICDQAARLGYHVICLRYPNEPSVDTLADQSTDPNVHEQVRRERLYGDDTSPLVSVDRANSIENRLVKLVEYLAAEHPDEGWGQFLQDGAPDWSRLAVGGHSQGSGQAALIAKDHLVERVVMFAGPADERGGSAAPWIGVPGATPLGRWFEFQHERDFLANSISLDLAALGFDDRWSPVRIDDQAPASGQHWLTTNYPVGTDVWAGVRAHNSVVVDGQTPRDAQGDPFFSGAWQHMLTSAVTMVGDANDDGQVNLDDFGLIKASFGHATDWSGGDFDDNGMVDLSDFGLFKANFGNAAVVAPEPPGLPLLGLGAALAWSVVRRSRVHARGQLS